MEAYTPDTPDKQHTKCALVETTPGKRVKKMLFSPVKTPKRKLFVKVTIKNCDNNDKLLQFLHIT